MHPHQVIRMIEVGKGVQLPGSACSLYLTNLLSQLLVELLKDMKKWASMAVQDRFGVRAEPFHTVHLPYSHGPPSQSKNIFCFSPLKPYFQKGWEICFTPAQHNAPDTTEIH